MPNYDEITNSPATIELQEDTDTVIEKKTFGDYFSLAVTTFGVGYLPLAPGTWGSLVGVVIYLFIWAAEAHLGNYFLYRDVNGEIVTAWVHAINVILFLAFCLIGVWASDRASYLFQTKDPQKVVVDEVMGQLLVFMFIPFDVRWYYVVAGFLLFRLFDIWKPYPIRSLESLPTGIGICADDLLAGVYGGACLALIFAIKSSL